MVQTETHIVFVECLIELVLLLRAATAYVKWVFSAMSIIKIDLCDAIQRLT